MLPGRRRVKISPQGDTDHDMLALHSTGGVALAEGTWHLASAFSIAPPSANCTITTCKYLTHAHLTAHHPSSSPFRSTASPNTSTNQHQLQLYNVTLILPLADFAALYSAAARGPAWRSGAVTTAPLISGISVFEVDAAQTSRQSIRLAQYEGWGCWGEDLTLKPELPLSDDLELPDWSPASPPKRHSVPPGTATSTANLGLGLPLGLGLGLGLVVLVSVVAAAVFWHRRRCSGLYFSGRGKKAVDGSVDAHEGGKGGELPRSMAKEGPSQAADSSVGKQGESTQVQVQVSGAEMCSWPELA